MPDWPLGGMVGQISERGKEKIALNCLRYQDYSGNGLIIRKNLDGVGAHLGRRKFSQDLCACLLEPSVGQSP